MATLTAVALASCGGEQPPADKLAAPLAEALVALGVHGLSWSRAVLDGDSIVILDVKGSLDGLGPVHASEIAVTRFAKSDAGWNAASLRAEGVDGSIVAKRIVINQPLANKLGDAWTLRDGGRTVEGYAGPAFGIPVVAQRATVEPAPAMGARPASRRLSATGLRLQPNGLPAALTRFANLDWNVAVRADTTIQDRAFFEIERAETKDWAVRGTVGLSGPAGFVTTLSSLGPTVLFDPGRWPEGILLRDADLDLSLMDPAVFVGPRAVDPVAGSMAAAAAEAKPVTWHVAVAPRAPVEVRALPALFRSQGADGMLGLTVTGTGLLKPAPAGQTGAPAPSAVAKPGATGR